MIGFHPMVRRDLAAAMRHYQRLGTRLADDFWILKQHATGPKAIRTIFILIHAAGEESTWSGFPITSCLKRS